MILDALVSGLYVSALAGLGLFGLHRLWMIARVRWKGAERFPASCAGNLPGVTVQLPLFNERTVAARLVRAAGALSYPRERLEIQVLDDSTDETCAIVDAEVAELRARGLDAKVLRRSRRTGFKAGALAFGLEQARGEHIAVFDADFAPRPDFLLRLVPALEDERIGLVQARWEHGNRDDGALTRAQSALLDGHFVVEHTFRYQNGLFFNFNGTAGIWRRAAIEDAGGWQHDTLTEDLDLSYRAQLRGWRFVYAAHEGVPSEVPADLAAFQGQQQRWAKGSVQVARKLCGRILRADLPLRVKLEAGMHLTSNAGYPFVLALALLLPLVTQGNERFPSWWHWVAFLLCTLSVAAFYDRGQRALGRSLRQRLFDVPAAMALGVGMCVGQTRAVLEGLFPQTGEFVRTPKRGAAPATALYRPAQRGWPVIELLLAAWAAWGMACALHAGVWGSVPFLALFFAGFLWVVVASLREVSQAWVPRRSSTDPPGGASSPERAPPAKALAASRSRSNSARFSTRGLVEEKPR